MIINNNIIISRLGMSRLAVATMLEDSYLPDSSLNAAAAAETASSRKEVKYSDIPASYSFQPIAVISYHIII